VLDTTLFHFRFTRMRVGTQVRVFIRDKTHPLPQHGGPCIGKLHMPDDLADTFKAMVAGRLATTDERGDQHRQRKA
jgi:hypothetical protein